MTRTVACALIHHPVLDRAGEVVTSAITNIDLHDISRSALTFGLSDYFIVHPVEAQRALAERIREHWVSGSGGRRIPDRRPALEIVRVVESLEAAIAQWRARLGDEPQVWTTSARRISDERALSLAEARAKLEQAGPPVLLCFGTGWGLAPSVHQKAAHQLEPIASPRADGYNHLSVRAAAAICFDRLLGTR